MTATSPGHAALAELADAFQEADRAPPSHPGLPLPLLRAIRHAVRADVATFRAVDGPRRTCRWSQDLEGDRASTFDGEGTGPVVLPGTPSFWDHFWDFEPCSYPERTGDLTSVTRVSDFLGDRALHDTAMHADYFGPLGLERHLLLVLPGGVHGSTVRLYLSRGAGRDFSDGERLLLELLRPRVARTFRRSGARSAPGGDAAGDALTRRQREVLQLAREGATNDAIARRLAIAEGTVRKHLEHAYAVLGVSSRTAAVAVLHDLL